jgi:hypothetical protein
MQRKYPILASLLKLIAVVAVFLAFCGPSSASVLLGLPEKQEWSDMAFPNASGGFNAGTKELTITGLVSNDLEIGSQFGPLNPGRHYSSNGGTLGGGFNATLTVGGVIIQPNGTVTNGGNVSVIYNGGAPGSIGTDYGISGGSSLLSGYVLEVGLDPGAFAGTGTLDVVFHITGGALQNFNPGANANFASANTGIIRVSSRSPQSGDFSTGFSLTGTVDVLGVIPEFPYTTTAVFFALFVFGVVWTSSYRRANSSTINKTDNKPLTIADSVCRSTQ